MKAIHKLFFLFFLGTMSSPLFSMDCPLKNHPTSFLGMMALRQQDPVYQAARAARHAAFEIQEKIEHDRLTKIANERRLQQLDADVKKFSSLDKENYNQRELKTEQFLAYVTVFGEREKVAMSINCNENNPISPNSVSQTSPAYPKSILKKEGSLKKLASISYQL